MKVLILERKYFFLKKMTDLCINQCYRHYFLAQGGVNTQVLIKELGTIHLGGLEEHRQPIQDTDVEGYLEQQNTETLMNIMNDGRKEVYIMVHQRHSLADSLENRL
jgi:hypothetical protein